MVCLPFHRHSFTARSVERLLSSWLVSFAFTKFPALDHGLCSSHHLEIFTYMPPVKVFLLAKIKIKYINNESKHLMPEDLGAYFSLCEHNLAVLTSPRQSRGITN